MKSIWCTIWILSALLVIATLDTLPDPPAVNPSPALSGLQLHQHSCDTTGRRSESVVISYPLFVSLVIADARAPYRPSDRMVITGQMSDLPPPASRVARKPSFQS